MKRRFRKRVDEPTMSDNTLLVSVEDLIHQAFGIQKRNRVNFKVIQAILHILARQLNMLEQDVEIKVDEIIDLVEDAGHDDELVRYSNASVEEDELIDDKTRIERSGKGAERQRASKKDAKTRDEKGEKKEPKDRLEKGEKKDGKTYSKDRERQGRSKDKDGKDERSTERDKSSGRKRGEDDEDGRERGRDRERGGEQGADGREGTRGEREGDGGGGRGSEREADGRGGRGGGQKAEGRGGGGAKHQTDGRGGRAGEHEADRRGGRGGEREADGRGGIGGEREADGRGGIGGEREADERGGREGERETDGRGGRVGGREAKGREGRQGDREDRDTQRQDRGGIDFRRQTSGTTLTGGRPARIGSIEIVTASQFALLGKAVKQLEQITGPLPEPVLPDNKTLRQDLAKGHASLPDTMQIMQLNARLQAAQRGLYRMAEMLTQLAQSGMLPPEFADHVAALEEYLRVAKSAGSAPGSPGGPGDPVRPSGSVGAVSSRGMRGKRSGKPGGPGTGRGGTGGAPSPILPTVSTMSSPDKKKYTATVTEDATKPDKPRVTHNEMNETLKRMRISIDAEINKLINRANHSADIASNMSRTVAEKLDNAMQINARVDTLVQQAEDYMEQFSGFDTGIMTQVNSFQEQLLVMRKDLSGNLALLEASYNNTETTALLDLSERHHGLVGMMKNTANQHQHLHYTQVQISDELKSLVQCVETLREQKIDRDEALDGLRDKANLTRLAGLLYEKDFAHARSDIEKRIEKCYEMFSREDMMWREALRELTAAVDTKAELSTLMALRDATVAELGAIHKLLLKLEIMLGEPKAAILMRKLLDATCSERLTRALVRPQDAAHGKPLPLPALRPPLPPRLPPLGAEHEPCLGEVYLAPPDIRVGGSHTMMSDNVMKEQAEPMQLQIIPTKKFKAYGSDGRLYMMEEGMQPCAECNKLLPCTGAGDQASGPPV